MGRLAYCSGGLWPTSTSGKGSVEQTVAFSMVRQRLYII